MQRYGYTTAADTCSASKSWIVVFDPAGDGSADWALITPLMLIGM